MLKRGADDLDDLVQRLAPRVGDLRLGQDDLGGHSTTDIATANAGGKPGAVPRTDCRADLELHALRRAFADEQVEIAPNVGGYSVVHAVAADPRRATEGEA